MRAAGPRARPAPPLHRRGCSSPTPTTDRAARDRPRPRRAGRRSRRRRATATAGAPSRTGRRRGALARRAHVWPRRARAARLRHRFGARAAREPSRRCGAPAPGATIRPSPSAACNGRCPHRGPDRRRMPRAGSTCRPRWPDEPDPLARGDGEIDAVEDRAGAADDGQVVNEEGAGHARELREDGVERRDRAGSQRVNMKISLTG